MSQTVTRQIHWHTSTRGRRSLRRGAKPVPVVPTGRIPRLSRLMALAIRMDRLIAEGAVKDQAEIAEIGYVTRARVSQIMNLLSLAPDIQEQILFLPRVEHGRDPITEQQVRPITMELDWAQQRLMWASLVAPRRDHEGS